MNISVVIPCHNEERYLPSCLERLKKQTYPPHEIIVVDNNSIDSSANIAKKFGARIVKEPIQGMIPARNRGFNEAKGDIIARCDADTLVPVDWLERIQKDYETHPFDGLTGLTVFYDYHSRSTSFSKMYLFTMKCLLLGHNVLQGPNMIIAKEAWELVKNDVCLNDKEVHEDIDLSIHLAYKHKEVRVDKNLIVEISGRRLENNPLSFFIEYPKRVITTIFSKHSH